MLSLKSKRNNKLFMVHGRYILHLQHNIALPLLCIWIIASFSLITLRENYSGEEEVWDLDFQEIVGLIEVNS